MSSEPIFPKRFVITLEFECEDLEEAKNFENALFSELSRWEDCAPHPITVTLKEQ